MNDPSQQSARSFPLWPPPFHPHPRPVWKPKNPPSLPPPSSSGYRPPALKELQRQNRVRARRFYPGGRRKFPRSAPYAPRNTSTFIMRSKRSGGIPPAPSPVTPAVLPTPRFSPSTEITTELAREEFGVDGYGSMSDFIFLRSPTGDDEAMVEEDEEAEGSSGSDVEEHIEMERRLDHDLSRFEMVYRPAGPSCAGDHDAHLARLEEENLTLREKLFLMETEMGELRRRVQVLEAARAPVAEENYVDTEEVTSENDGDAGVLNTEKIGGD